MEEIQIKLQNFEKMIKFETLQFVEIYIAHDETFILFDTFLLKKSIKQR